MEIFLMVVPFWSEKVVVSCDKWFKIRSTWSEICSLIFFEPRITNIQHISQPFFVPLQYIKKDF